MSHNLLKTFSTRNARSPKMQIFIATPEGPQLHLCSGTSIERHSWSALL